MKYPYVNYAGKYLTIIGIEIKGREDWVIFDAYVDSGAGHSIFHTDVAEILGVDIEKGKE